MTKRDLSVPPPATPVPVQLPSVPPAPPPARLVSAWQGDDLPPMAVWSEENGHQDDPDWRGHERRFWLEVAALLAIALGFAGVAAGVTWGGIELFTWLGWGAE